MARYFDFKRLIEKYQTEFVAVIPSQGEYDTSGDFIPGAPKRITLRGAIINMRESRVMRSEGVVTAQDKSLYVLQPLDDALKNAKIIHQGKMYTIDANHENAEFTGVYFYVLKYISVFKDGDDT